MANYRPKSLDELNSFYDKTLSSQNVINDNASAINTDSFAEINPVTSESIDDFFAEHSNFMTGTCVDLTEDINRFIANFGKPATRDDEFTIYRRPVPIKLRQKAPQPKPVKFSPEPVPAPAPVVTPVQSTEAAETHSAQETVPEQIRPEKTELILTAEKNELFAEYMRIMSDEDDDTEYSRSRASRKRRKNKKAAEEANPVQEAVTEEAPTADIPSEDTVTEIDTDDTESFVSFTPDIEKTEDEPVKEASEKDIPEKEIPEKKEADSFFPDDEENESDEEEAQPRKKTASQLLLFLLLFVTLLCALGATVIRTVVKVNSGELFADKYYVYSADFTDKVTDINEGELIIIENTRSENGEVFAYNTPDGLVYAVQTFSGEPERTSGKNGTSDSIVVMNTAIKGTVVRCIPALGNIAGIITENFMTVIVSLLVIAVLIILLLIFAFRHTADKDAASTKNNFSFDEDEEEDEATEEEENFSLT